jgi:hypothetical protein
MADAKKQLTPEERIENWWNRRPLPFYVKTKSKHHDAIYLIETREDLHKLATYELKTRYEDGYFGSEDDYFSGTFEEFVEKQMGMTQQEADALFGIDRKHVEHNLQRAQNRYLNLMTEYGQNVSALQAVRRAEGLVKFDRFPMAVVQFLLDRSSFEYEFFSIEHFDKVPE